MMSSTSPSPALPLKIYIIPFLSPSHMIPILEIGRLLASLGQEVTVITTHSNATFLQPILAKHAALCNHPISVHSVKFPSQQVGLPDGIENLKDINGIESAGKLFRGIMLLQQEMESFINAYPPDCIFSDPNFPWTADVAARLRIPRLAYLVTCTFTASIYEALRLKDSPHLTVQSDDEPFVIPGLPHPITITRAQLPDYVQKPYGYTQLMDAQREAERRSYGVVVNGFEEIESEYSEHYRNLMGHRVYHVGPTCLIFRSQDDHECLHWLNAKKPNSVIYVCFGSACVWTERQLTEIAHGLDSAGYDFVWVLTPKNFGGGSNGKDWMPAGFEKKGFLVKGWAPQVAILEHPAVGGFMTHCGWSSTVEGMSAGVPMATWPLCAEQFYHEKLVTQMLRIGVEVGSDEWYQYGDVEKRKLIKRDKIEKVVRAVMDDGSAAVVEMRKRVGELKKNALAAVGEGGSTEKALTSLVEDLMQERKRRSNE